MTSLLLKLKQLLTSLDLLVLLQYSFAQKAVSASLIPQLITHDLHDASGCLGMRPFAELRYKHRVVMFRQRNHVGALVNTVWSRSPMHFETTGELLVDERVYGNEVAPSGYLLQSILRGVAADELLNVYFRPT